MDTLPLPPRPDLDQYRKRAKALVAAANSGDAAAVRQWATDWLTALAKRVGVEISPFVQDSFDRVVEGIEHEVARRVAGARSEGSALALADAQHLVAQAHSYDSWADFAREIEGLRSDAGKSAFERAADAVVEGNLSRLDELLAKDPDLVTAHSARKHRATLLHYVAANGVEDFRQKTPPNAVEVARRLIVAGAEVDALAATYGGDRYQTALNLLVSSTHPADAGLQPALVEVLLDYGAAIDGLDGNGSPLLTALAFGHCDAADTLARRGARIDHVVVAAAVGRLDLVLDWVIDAATLSKRHGPYRGPSWVHIPDDTKGQIEMALVWACKFGRADVARALLDLGVDPAATDHDRMSALHWASAAGMIDIMKELIARGAPLEIRNVWGGTVVDSTVYFAMNVPNRGVDYPAVIECLLAAGANVEAVEPPVTGIPGIDAILERYRDS